MVWRTHLRWTCEIAAVVGGSLGLTFCDRIVGLVDPQFPSDAEEFSPPAVYSTWWKMTEACSGMTGSLGAITWFRTGQALHAFPSGDPLGGYWSPVGNRIVLTNDLALDGGVVRHEMLHALLRKGGHPRNQFLGKCMGTVHCPDACIRDAGPYPHPAETPIHVTGDSLAITLDVEPRNPTVARDGGFFSMSVMVRNRSTHWVTVPSVYSLYFPDVDSTRTFETTVRGPSGGISIPESRLDPSEWIFAPGETKKHVFDFEIGNDLRAFELPPGHYIARGGYSDYWGADSSFVVGQ